MRWRPSARRGQNIGERALIGVGTVLDADTCRAAIAAGAEFVVTPICRTELVAIAHAAGCPIMLGAYTPTEAQLAHEAGADFVKLFPADSLGPGYVKALRAPLPHLRIVPTGGVDVQNVADFLKAGCAALGVGSSLVSAKILQAADWPELTRRASAFVTAARQARELTLSVRGLRAEAGTQFWGRDRPGFWALNSRGRILDSAA